MRTKQEVINFLESKLGTKVPCKGNPDLDGMCVTLIKSLMEFLGVPDPYKARGHAKTVISAYLSEGIAKPGLGFISVFSNKNMGSGYGHIWCNAGDGDGTFYESNGVKPLTVTKGKTYSYDNVCNFDSYIQVADPSTDKQKELDEAHRQIDNLQAQVNGLVGEKKQLTLQITSLSSELGTCRSEKQALVDKVQSLNNIIGEYQKEDAVQISDLKTAQDERTYYKNLLEMTLWDYADTLKLSQGSMTLDEKISAVSEALTAFYSSSNLANDKIKSLEDEIKRLNTYKRPIAKISTKDLILYLLKKLIGKV